MISARSAHFRNPPHANSNSNANPELSSRPVVGFRSGPERFAVQAGQTPSSSGTFSRSFFLRRAELSIRCTLDARSFDVPSFARVRVNATRTPNSFSNGRAFRRNIPQSKFAPGAKNNRSRNCFRETRMRNARTFRVPPAPIDAAIRKIPLSSRTRRRSRGGSDA